METKAIERRLRALVLLVTAMAAGGPAARAQGLNAPHVGYVYPAGGRQGTTVRILVGGRYLDGVSGAIVSGEGVGVQPVGLDKPLTGQQLTDLRDKGQEMAKTARTPEERQALNAIRLRIGDSVRRNANPVLGEIATLDVGIAANAPPGPRQIRLLTANGLSNPLVFCVGQFAEFQEKDEKTSADDAEVRVTLPATINGRVIPGDVDRARAPLRQPGQYAPGDVDRYRFAARKGQDIVAVVAARGLMPYLADAVPGWFQATLALVDGAGRDVAYADGFRFEQDPVLHARIPADGDYVLVIKDALYRGREDFVYRITVGEIPFITGVFPLGARAGTRAEVALNGWNLPVSRVTLDTRGIDPGVTSVSISRGERSANRVPFAVDTLPEVAEREPDDSVKDAQPLTLPVIVNGRIGKPGDTDVFSFRGKAGQAVVADVEARRLGSPLDSALELTDAAGTRIAFNDDFDDPDTGVQTHHADSRLSATLPADGAYLLRVVDVQRHGGPDYAYRLIVGPPRPDFELRVTPSELNSGPGTNVPITVHALRRDGFSGEIDLALKGVPSGFTLSGGTIPAGASQVRATITLAPPATKEPLALALEGRAVIDGKTVVRRAVPATDMMQAFAYHHLVPSDSLRVSVLQRGGLRTRARILGPDVVRIPGGGAAKVRVSVPWPRAFEHYALELSEPPDGVTLGDAAFSDDGAEFTLRADAAAKPAPRGNLIVVVTGERVPRPPNGQAAPAAAARTRIPLFTLPAIPFEIVR